MNPDGDLVNTNAQTTAELLVPGARDAISAQLDAIINNYGRFSRDQNGFSQIGEYAGRPFSGSQMVIRYGLTADELARGGGLLAMQMTIATSPEKRAGDLNRIIDVGDESISMIDLIQRWREEDIGPSLQPDAISSMDAFIFLPLGRAPTLFHGSILVEQRQQAAALIVDGNRVVANWSNVTQDGSVQVGTSLPIIAPVVTSDTVTNAGVFSMEDILQSGEIDADVLRANSVTAVLALGNKPEPLLRLPQPNRDLMWNLGDSPATYGMGFGKSGENVSTGVNVNAAGSPAISGLLVVNIFPIAVTARKSLPLNSLFLRSGS